MSSSRQVAGNLRFLVLAVGVIAISVVLAPQAQADDVNVTCPPHTPGPGEYTGIQPAVNAVTAVSLTGPHTITVKGDCTGRIFIGDGINVGPRGIAILAAPEGASIQPASATGTVVQICGAQDIYLEGLVIRGGGVGLSLCDLAEVDTLGLTIEDNTSRGIEVFGNSVLFFQPQTVIRNNGGTGVRVRGGSRVFFLSGLSSSSIEVYGHSLWGINAEGGSVMEVTGPHQIHDNGTAGDANSGGVRISRTSELLAAPNAFGAPEFSNNAGGPGVLLETGSSARFQGATLSNNAGPGVQVQRLSVAELTNPNTFSGNGGAAISCDNSAWVAGDLTGIKPLGCSNVAKPPK